MAVHHVQLTCVLKCCECSVRPVFLFKLTRGSHRSLVVAVMVCVNYRGSPAEVHRQPAVVVNVGGSGVVVPSSVPLPVRVNGSTSIGRVLPVYKNTQATVVWTPTDSEYRQHNAVVTGYDRDAY